MGKSKKEEPAPNSSEKMEAKNNNTLKQVKVGMTAHVMIPLEKKSAVLLVPVSSLVKQGGRTGVFSMKTGKPGVLYALSFCNIHGLWENAEEIKLS